MERLIIFLISIYLLSSCRKEDEFTTNSSAKLEFSSQEVLFDTIFTSIGSATKRIKIFNRNKKGVKISSIELAGGNLSFYNINVNGQAVTQLNDVEIRGEDSIYLFVKVEIDPGTARLPFLISDSVAFLTNGNLQYLRLSAYGQNANFIRDGRIDENTTWENNIPYVIYNSLHISKDKSLTIPQGCQVYFHKDAGMDIEGTLKVEGSHEFPVLFQSDRREDVYADEPGQWLGLHFLQGSMNNIINNAIIKNAVTAIQADSLSSNNRPKVMLLNSSIKNMTLAAIAGIHTEITGFNNLLSNCGQHLIYAVNGGNYNFKQNTFVNYNFYFSRTEPSLFFSDHLSASQQSQLNVTIINNIIWGSRNDEITIEKKSNAVLNMLVRNNLIRSSDKNLTGLGNIVNTDPAFADPQNSKFTLSENSAANNKGENLSADEYFTPWLSTDKEGKIRLFPSELGCYELL